jgi:hypothetical protein
MVSISIVGAALIPSPAAATHLAQDPVLTVSSDNDSLTTYTSDPPGINCGDTCVASFEEGTEVTITYTDEYEGVITYIDQSGTGSDCQEWSSGSCTLVMDGDKTVFAFTTREALQSYPVQVSKAGNLDGVVTSSPAGIDCGSTCENQFDNGQSVVLSAIAPTGTAFSGWSNGCTGTGTCTVSASPNVDRHVTATFATVQTHALTVAKAGTGSGTVASAPPGINCGDDCTQPYNVDSVVTLTATPAADSVFTGWSNGGCSGTEPCPVDVDAAKTVTATFNLKKYALSVSRNGTGTGSVITTTPGISCGVDCTEQYDAHTVVRLVASPTDNSSFVGWTGACTHFTIACDVTMEEARSVAAEFIVTPARARYRPDAIIKKSSSAAPVGDDIYWTAKNAATQTVPLNVPRGQTRTIEVRIENDGNVTDSFTIEGRGSSPPFTVTYKRGTTVVTSAVVGGTFTTGPLAPGAAITLKMIVKAASNATVGTKKALPVDVDSVSQPDATDTVKAALKVT